MTRLMMAFVVVLGGVGVCADERQCGRLCQGALFQSQHQPPLGIPLLSALPVVLPAVLSTLLSWLLGSPLITDATGAVGVVGKGCAG